MDIVRLYLAITTALVLIVLLAPAAAEVAPVIRVNYVEVLEFKGGAWSSRYLQLTSSTLRLETSAEILIVRTDSSSGLAPVKVFVDGVEPQLRTGTGFLWNSLILQLDGRPHVLLVVFNDVLQIQPVAYITAIYKGEARPGENLTIPGLPGLTPAGFSLTVFITDIRNLSAIAETAFLLNLSEVSLAGEKIYAATLLVPRTFLSLKGGFLKCFYSYLYITPKAYAAAITLGGTPVFTFINHPSVKALSSSLLLGKPPRLALLVGVEDVAIAGYNVTLEVELPEDLCGTRVSYRLLPPEGAEITGRAVSLRDNTTVVVRFYKGGLAAADVVVTTPPSSFRLAAPLYLIEVEFRDQMGNLVPSGSFVVIQQGKVVGTTQIVNGTSRVCGLPPGEYIFLAYRWGVPIARRSLYITGDSPIRILTNTTTVEVQVFRQGVGELLRNYTVLLHGGGFAEHVQADKKARIAGVPPGNYTLEVSKEGVPLAVVNLSISWGMSSFSLTLPVYRLKVKVLDALDRPLVGATVLLKGKGFAINFSVGQSGIIDLGYLPSGEYEVTVELGYYVHAEKVVLTGDSIKYLRTSVVATLNHLILTSEHLQLAGLALAFFLIIILLRSVIRQIMGKREKVVEV